MNTLLRIPFNQATPVFARVPVNPPRRILVVEDETYLRQLITEVLLHSGYQVDAAADGILAWEASQLNRYDLLVTDDSMGRFAGLGLVSKLQAAQKALPVILVSESGPTNELDWHPWLQIDATLLKPFTTVELLQTVRQILWARDSAHEQIEQPIPLVMPLVREPLRAVCG